MNANNLDAKLLAAVRCEVARLRAVNLHNLPLDRFAAGRLREAVRDAKAGIIAVDFAELLGISLDAAERQSVTRAAERLEVAGHLRRLRRGHDGRKTTHLELIERN